MTETGPFYTEVEAGDIVYYNPMDSITIIYAPTSSVPTLTKMGEITSDVEAFSFENDAQGDKVQTIASALNKCSTIKSTQDGQTAELTLNGLSFPNLGDQTLALRANVKMKDIEAVTDMVFVAVGHNIVSFTTVGFRAAHRQPPVGPG